MTLGQQESLYLIYVNIANGLIYSEDLCNDDTLSKSAKDSVRVLRDKFRWMKTAMELKTNSSLLKSVDTMRYDEILRLMSSLEDDQQDELECIIKNYIDKFM